MQTSKLLLIGLPDSGKTTFLIALWHVVESGEVAGSLRLIELHGNLENLNTLRREWLACKPLPRTTKEAEKSESMRLGDPGGPQVAEVFFPHLSGESFREQFEERKCSREYYELAREAAGALVFVHPADVSEPVRIDAADRMMEGMGSAASSDGEGAEAVEAWSPSHTPTQVKLVELLQFHADMNHNRPLRIGVIVSAWDLVVQERRNPRQWLAYHLPLFDQFLRANDHTFLSKVYGVSAQGGRIPEESEMLLDKTRHADRIIIQDEDEVAHDLSRIVRWIMSE